jgi:hypothetical protein
MPTTMNVRGESKKFSFFLVFLMNFSAPRVRKKFDIFVHTACVYFTAQKCLQFKPQTLNQIATISHSNFVLKQNEALFLQNSKIVSTCTHTH